MCNDVEYTNKYEKVKSREDKGVERRLGKFFGFGIEGDMTCVQMTCMS